jgi:hypothetical protein
MGRPKGKTNGELLLAAAFADDDVLLTVDQGLPRQHSSPDRTLSIIVMHSRSNQLEDLLPLVSDILEALETIQPGQTVEISE